MSRKLILLTAAALAFTWNRAGAVDLNDNNLVPGAAANTNKAARVQYSKSRDGRYIYLRSASQLEFGNPEQARALRTAFDRIRSQIEQLKKQSPRAGSMAKIDQALIDEANKFDQSVDGIVNYMQKYYGELDSLRQYANLATPTALVAFTGVNWSKTQGWTPIKVAGGGSVVMGLVILPQTVRRVEIDTGKVNEYFDFDTALIFWPAGNLGLALGPSSATPAAPSASAGTGENKKLPLSCTEGLIGGSQRFGLGLVWGRLDQAADFHGMITGVSLSGGARVRGNIKLQALTNWTKKKAISNIFLTAAVECREITPFEIHGSLGYIVPAANFLGLSAGKAGSPEEVLVNAAARMIDREAGAAAAGIGLPLMPITEPLPQPLPTLIEED